MSVQEGLRWCTLAGQTFIIGLQFYICFVQIPRLVKAAVAAEATKWAVSFMAPKIFLNCEELVPHPDPADDPPPPRTH